MPTSDSFSQSESLPPIEMKMKIQCHHKSLDSLAITLNTMYSLIIYSPWLRNRAGDDTDFSIILVSQSGTCRIRQNNNIPYFAYLIVIL